MVVPGARIELALPFRNRILNPARLPVPPPRLDHLFAQAACRQAPGPKGGKYMRQNRGPPHYTEENLRPFSNRLHPRYET